MMAAGGIARGPRLDELPAEMLLKVLRAVVAQTAATATKAATAEVRGREEGGERAELEPELEDGLEALRSLLGVAGVNRRLRAVCFDEFVRSVELPSRRRRSVTAGKAPAKLKRQRGSLELAQPPGGAAHDVEFALARFAALETLVVRDGVTPAVKIRGDALLRATVKVRERVGSERHRSRLLKRLEIDVALASCDSEDLALRQWMQNVGTHLSVLKLNVDALGRAELDAFFAAICDVCGPRLRELRLRGVGHQLSQFASLTKIRHLEHLDFGHSMIGEAQIDAISQLEHLRSLRVPSCGLFDDNCLALLVDPQRSRLCRLELLDISYCTLVTDRGLQTLAKHRHFLRALRELELTGLSKITAAGARTIAKHIAPLRVLDIAACPAISDSGIAALLAAPIEELRGATDEWAAA